MVTVDIIKYIIYIFYEKKLLIVFFFSILRNAFLKFINIM